MKPAQFEYLRPTNLDEALECLSLYGSDAKIISGGQSLIPLLNMRLSTPRYLVDIGRIEGLDYLYEDEANIVIGARTRHIDVERSSLVKEKCGILTEAIHHVGHPQIRSRGTIAGSIAHGDPSAELTCLISALRGEIIMASSEGQRSVSPEEFFLSYLLTAIEPNEMVKEVRFPKLSPTSGYAFLELARRSGDFGLVEVAAVLDLADDRTISEARLAVGGASAVPTVLEEIEEYLIGKKPTETLFKEVSEEVKDYIEPDDDMHGSAAYRSQLASVLTKRALNQASERALGGVKV